MKRNIQLPPHMQMAYMNTMRQASAQGAVNPQLSADRVIQQGIAQEAQRFQQLDEAGHARKSNDKQIERYKQRQAKSESFSQEVLGLKQKQFKSAKIGDWVSNIIGLGQFGLGYMDAQKTKHEAGESRKFAKNNLMMQLDYLKKHNPQQYKWFLSQPHIQTQLQQFNIAID
jgi:hypothetical protein